MVGFEGVVGSRPMIRVGTGVVAAALACIPEMIEAKKNPITAYIAVDRRSNKTQWPEVIDALQAPLSAFRHQI